MVKGSQKVLESFARVVKELSDPAVLLDTSLNLVAYSEGFVAATRQSDSDLAHAFAKGVSAFSLLSESRDGDRRAALEVLNHGEPIERSRRSVHSLGGDEYLMTQSFRAVTDGECTIIGVWINYREHEAADEQRLHGNREHVRAETLEREVAKRTAQLTAALERVTRLSIVDPLTGLMNRRAFDEHAATVHDLAERHSRNFAVLMCDLDFFKRVNDTYGHGAGDDVLVSTANALKQATRTSDKVARFGGEEFVVLLSETDESAVEHVAARCGAGVRAIPISDIIEGADFQQTISIGIAIYPQHGTHIEKLLEHADRALYEAKTNGRDRAEVYSESMADASGEATTGVRARVLVVEPHAERAAQYRDVLSAAFDVVLVAGADEALALCARQQFAALVSDEDAGRESGVDFLQKSTALLPMAKRLLILEKPDANTAMRGTNRAQTDHILTRSGALEELAISIEHCLLRTQLATADQRQTHSGPTRESIDAAALDAFYAVLGAKRVNVDYVPILASHSHELVAFHAEPSAPHRYFSESAGPSLDQVAAALESTWELGQLIRRSIAIDLPTLGLAQVFLPIHPSELANEGIYKDTDNNLLSLMRDRIVLSIAEDEFINDTDVLHERIAKLKTLGYGLAVRSKGSGFASLSTLAALQPDYLQLDVTQLCGATDPSHIRLIECFIGFAHTEGILTVAEGVSSDADAEYLKGLGFSLLMGGAFTDAKHQDFDESDDVIDPAA